MVKINPFKAILPKKDFIRYFNKSLADAMEWILDNESERRVMAANALRLAKTEFNRDILASKYLKAIIQMNRKSKKHQELIH